MTVPRPPESPLSRRAARALRDEVPRRAPNTDLKAAEPPASTLPLPIVGSPDAIRAIAAAPPLTRRTARAAELLTAADVVPVQHARPRRALRIGVMAGLAGAAALLLGSAAAVTAMVADDPPAVVSKAEGPAAASRIAALPNVPVAALPVPVVEQAEATRDICALPDVVEALAAGDDEGVVSASGGGEAFRSAIVGGLAPCITLEDPARNWAVINKTRPSRPLDYRPAALVLPDDVRTISGASLRPDAASALTDMTEAARAAGVGELALDSGFRSYSTQQSTYNRHVSDRGFSEADLVSARPGHSEHQSGLAADIVACNGGCGSIDDLAATAQGQWLVEHAWEFGWIARYEDGHTQTTGYRSEPWHLRYIGHALARAYHDGQWHSLEDFFSLPAAPTYLG